MITEKAIEKLKAMRRQAEINAAGNTDAQALDVSTLYADWETLEEGYSLTVGDRVTYNDVLYNVITAHNVQSTWNPVDSPSLFAKVLIPDPEVIPEWEQPDSTNPYSKGDRVTHNEKTWESLVDNNVWEPGALGTESLWKDVSEE